MRRFLGILTLFLGICAQAQVLNAPSLRCISCNAAGNITLTWVIPSDPGNLFFDYSIYRAPSISGTYTLVGTVNTHTISTFTDLTPSVNGNTQSWFYYVVTRYGVGGTSTSTPSDTLKSIHLDLNALPNGVAQLSYNTIHNPKLSSTGAAFNIYREFPATVWSNIKSTAAFAYNDTSYNCDPETKNYQIQLTDVSGCFSASNIVGDVFEDLLLLESANAVLDSVSVNANGQTALGWTPSSAPDCAGYVIYHFNGAWIAIDTVYGKNTTAFTTTNTPGNSGSALYCLAAIDNCRNITPLGYDKDQDQATIFLQNDYDMCGRSVNLSWTPYKNMGSGVAKYDVYYSVNGSNWSLAGSTSSTTFTHTGLAPGQTYCYRVRVFNNGFKITASSNLSCLIATAPPVTSFAYLKSVSVDQNQNVVVNFIADTLKSCKGFAINKSEDDLNFSNIAFVPFSVHGSYSYTDADVSTSAKNYFYNVVVLDSCGNPRSTTNTGKTVLLHVKNDNEKIFVNNLKWDDYSGWPGGITGYNVYRVVNEVPDSIPVNFVPFGVNTYTDNVEDIVSASGKIGYFVQAVENFGNPYGFTATSNSNIGYAYVEATIFVPNAFAPEGANRFWLPVTQFVEMSDYHVSIFDRWGQKVFENDNKDAGWDGSGREQGVYAYLIQYKNSRGEFIELKGTITIVR